MITWLTESLPASIRVSGLGIVYAVSIAVFGGTTQYAVAWFIKVTGSPLAPAWYWVVAAAAGLAAVFATHETAPTRIGASAAASPVIPNLGNSFSRE